MRLALPIQNGAVSASLAACEYFRFYEDDHGALKRSYDVPMETPTTEAAVALVEQYGVDALLCGALSGEEKLACISSGVMLLPNFSGEPEAAALQFLGGAIASDPSNSCNACGHKGVCGLTPGSCGGAR